MRHRLIVPVVAMVTVMVMLSFATGCRLPASHGRSSHREYTPQPGLRTDDPLAKADTAFGFKLFRALTKAQPKDNVFISPASMAMALAMAYNGAAGETKTAIAQTLELGAMTTDSLNRASRALRKGLGTADPRVTLKIANSLWAGSGNEFSRPFSNANRQYYGSELATLDFTDPNSARVINDWVSKETDGNIPQIVAADWLHSLWFLLLDAVYFSGEWTDKFERSATKDLPFTRLDGTQKTVPMMTCSGDYWHAKTAEFEAIRLPYGDGRLAMHVFLPDKGSSLGAFCAALTPDKWNTWMGQLQKSDGSIALPRFEIEYDAKLKEALSELGMGIAFDKRRADFRPMHAGSDPLWIDDVLHKTFLEVTEEGTKAAATTAPGMVGMMRRVYATPFDMVVDRPFFCAICDDQTKAILFMGAIVDPGKM